jgi:hypothetical protein
MPKTNAKDQDVKKIRDHAKKMKALDTRIEKLSKLQIGKTLLFSNQTFSVPRKGQQNAM